MEVIKKISKPKSRNEKISKSKYDSFTSAHKMLIAAVCEYIDKNPRDFQKVDTNHFYGYQSSKDKKTKISFSKTKGIGLTVCFKYVDPRSSRHEHTYFHLTTKSINKVIKFYNRLYLKDKKDYRLNNKGVSEIAKELLEGEPKEKGGSGTVKTNKTTPNFTETLSTSEAQTISRFETKLRSYIDFIVDLTAYRICYKIIKDDVKYSLCWFLKEENQLKFKYYKSPNEIESLKKVEASLDNVDELLKDLIDVYLAYHGSLKPASDSVGESTRSQMYEYIVLGLASKKIDDNNGIASVAKEVVNFALNEIMHDAIESKVFENEEDFKRHWRYRRFYPNLYGYSVSIKQPTINNAKDAFEIFVAYKLVDIIKQNERIFNTQIISDEKLLLRGLKKGIKMKEINYSLLEGLLSTFRYVPTSSLNERVNFYLNLL